MKPLPTLLIIDDDEMSQRLLNRVLSPEFKLIKASEGEEGIRLARKWLPDLILLDILMPGIDGFDTFRRLAADPDLKRIPVIFISASPSPRDEVFALELGAVDYLQRPLVLPAVRQRIRNQLQYLALRKETEAQYFRLGNL